MLTPTLKRIEKATTVLVLEQPFYASLLLNLKVEESTAFPTFATDGKHLYVNPKFAETLDDAQLGTVLAHEVTHVACGHLWRMTPLSHPDKDVRNQAADYEVNEMLDDVNMATRNRAAPFPMPPGAHLDTRFNKMGAEKIYTTLAKEKKDGKQGGGGKKPGNQPGGKGQGQGKPDPTGSGTGMGEFLPLPGNMQEQKQQKQDWEQKIIQAVQAAQGKGDIPGHLKEMVEKMTRTVVDWKAVLREFLRRAKDDYSFSHPNRRYADCEFIMPSLHSESLGKILFAIDTSGSIFSRPEILAEFFGQAQLVLDELLPESLDIFCCDTSITKHETYIPGDTIKNEAPGGGGTDFKPVFDKLPEDVIAVVYLTDLEGSFPSKEPEIPTLWINYGRPEATAPFGTIVEVQQP